MKLKLQVAIMIIISCISFKTYAQKTNLNNGVESMFSAKVGFLGVWLNYENKLSKTLTLNTEVGYEGGITGGSKDLDFILTTSLSVEPKFYYNYFKRVKNGKTVKNNSANYLALELLYIPDFLSSTKKNNISIAKTFSIIPKWGLRRSLSSKMYFEFASGIGYAWYDNLENEVVVGLDLRVGYTF